MQVRVRRSRRRKKTVEAKVVDGVLEVAIPATLSAAEEQHWVTVMEERFSRQQTAAEIDLAARATRLATRYGLPHPRSVEWSERQRTRWGSCTPAQGSIRIATRLAPYPNWVIDYVIVHELAHLAEPNHGKPFWDLVGRYPHTAKARGYLEAKSDGR